MKMVLTTFVLKIAQESGFDLLFFSLLDSGRAQSQKHVVFRPNVLVV
jgi:hypothetical protein